MADQLKAEGNKAFAAKDFDKAIDLFSQAIELDPTNHVLYSNRSGAYASKKEFNKALEDAKKVTEIKSDWPKGWSRVAAAFHGLADYENAVEAYQKVLELDPKNAQAKSGLSQCQDQLAAGGADGGMGQIFNDPNMYAKLAANPTTAAYLADPTFKANLLRLQKNPSAVNEAIKDPRMMQVIGVLLGLNLQMGNPPEAAGTSSQDRDTEMKDAPPPNFTPVEVPEEANQHFKKDPAPEPEPEDEEAKAKKEAKEKADAEKLLGTENYKKRNFDAAIEHYSKAWDLHKDITYLNNLAAAKFEKGDFEGCISECKRAIEEGREMRADFKLIAKAFGRIGTAYQKQGDLVQAIEYYQRSLTEHRTPDILTKLRAAEKAKIEAEKKAYIDPVKAEEAREQGNKHFKDLNWPEAVKSYNEMIKRNPEDPRGYSNLAAALTKLGSLPEAIKACDDAIKRDPHFLRAHIRKAQAFILMKEFNKALDALSEAGTQDVDGKGASEIDKLTREVLEKMYSAREGETPEQTMERVQRDPEIASIIGDPVMQTILQQARANPAALNDHMKNPVVRLKIQKLIAAGIIRLG